jgi:hypothetical protein
MWNITYLMKYYHILFRLPKKYRQLTCLTETLGAAVVLLSSQLKPASDSFLRICLKITLNASLATPSCSFGTKNTRNIKELSYISMPD